MFCSWLIFSYVGSEADCLNLDLESLVTPLNVELFARLLRETKYDGQESLFLVDGFTNGFDIGYEGPEIRQSRSNNIPFTPGIGNKFEMWSKIMKEVKAGRVAGPFDEIPFQNFIQSPIGLVPKAGNKTRLIFHLSYNFDKPGDSLNGCMLKEKCSVKYNDLDMPVKYCLLLSERAEIINGHKIVYLEKTDLSNAFRVLCLNRRSFKWLVFKAEDPRDGKFKFFVDKCLPFVASISCSHYQRFSNALKHILQARTGCETITNYLDDFLFVAILKMLCDQLIQAFIDLCNEIGVPIAVEKTVWGDTQIIFLGILLDGEKLCLAIPLEKQQKELCLLNDILDHKKATIKQLQVLTGYLNFLTKAIFAGRTFT